MTQMCTAIMMTTMSNGSLSWCNFLSNALKTEKIKKWIKIIFLKIYGITIEKKMDKNKGRFAKNAKMDVFVKSINT